MTRTTSAVATGVPRLPVASLAHAVTDGYAFISRRCEELGTDTFRVSLPGRSVTFVRGAEASRLFYGTQHLTRQGAIPTFVQHLLQDEGSVQSLDGAAHHHRKTMFRHLLVGPGAGSISDLLAEDWQRALRYWSGQERIELLEQVQLLLTRTVLRWSGVPLAGTSVRRRATELAVMVDWIALLGPMNWAARTLRLRTERWARELVAAVRDGVLHPPEETALAVIARHREADGSLLSPAVAAVELVNVLRPVVAVSRFIAFAAVALIERPEWYETFAAGDETALEAFVHEVRRYYPFFPAVPGRVRDGVTWRGAELAAGDLLVLDLYGTNHDPRLWERPEVFAPERFRDWSGDPHTLVPQGGGDEATGHRCPGEPMTISLMKESVRQLTQQMTFTVPVQDLGVPLNRFPARPREGVLLSDVARR